MVRSQPYGLAVTGLVILGWALRVWGIRYGLPYQYHPDEPLAVNLALAMGYTRDLNPHWFIHPGFLFYALFVLYGGYYLIGLALGTLSSTHDFAIAILRDPSALYLIGRLLSAMASTATIPVVYLVGRQLYSRRAGLLAAMLFTPLYLTVYFAHFIKPESLQTFLTIVSFFFTVRVLRVGKPRDYVLAGWFTGLAAATKYPSILVGLAFVGAHVLRTREQSRHTGLLDRKLLAGLASTFFGFAVGAPFSLLEFRSVVQAFLGLNLYLIPQAGAPQNVISVWISDLRNWIGDIPLLLFGLGSGYAALQFSRENRVLLVFPLVHFVIFSLPAWKKCPLAGGYPALLYRPGWSFS